MLRFAFAALTALSAATFVSSGAPADAVAAIKSGQKDCPHCMLAGADLTNQCVKGGNLSGADFDRARLLLACMSNADFRNATFRGADLSGANLAGSKLDGADLTGAVLTITSIKGSDFTKAKGLTQTQIDAACGDAATRLPLGLIARVCN